MNASSNTYTCEEILKGIKEQNKEVLLYIYQAYYPIVESIIINQFNGNREQAKDLFQEALCTIYTTLVNTLNFKLQYKFITFLATICKRRMIDEIRKKKKLKYELKLDDYEDDNYISALIEKEERIKLYEKHFNKLGEKCKTILQMFIHGYSIKQVLAKLNMSSEQFVKKRKLQCKISLFRSIYKDPILKELINGKPWTIREIPRW